MCLIVLQGTDAQRRSAALAQLQAALEEAKKAHRDAFDMPEVGGLSLFGGAHHRCGGADAGEANCGSSGGGWGSGGWGFGGWGLGGWGLGWWGLGVWGLCWWGL